ncbi:MAG TPA: cytosine permease [Thermoanaerobaculia bacterium]|nr:cytosine permease [Thermoanaerobaculia bacterium]
MQAADLGPIPDAEKTQPAVDLFLIIAGANLVATTLQTGASLAPAFGPRQAGVLIVAGAVLGTALVAALTPLGPRLGVPSVIACRGALGLRGGALVSLILYVTNFAWIAVNNVIAASACARLWGGPSSERFWAFGLGILATAVVAGGPRAVSHADRVAVPLLLLVGGVLTFACLRLPAAVTAAPGDGSMTAVRGLDVVIGYQVSWLLIFGDYPRYTRSPARATGAVFLGLALTSLWFLPLGFVAARAAGSTQPGAMLAAAGIGGLGAVLLALATLSTNFVNIYMSALAWKSLVPAAKDRASVWTIGVVGAVLSLFSGWLERYADFMLLLGGLLVPVGGVLLARYFLVRRPVLVADLYAEDGPATRHGGFSIPGMCGWAAGAAAYFLAGRTGGTLPALATALVVTWALERALPRAAERTAP